MQRSAAGSHDTGGQGEAGPEWQKAAVDQGPERLEDVVADLLVAGHPRTSLVRAQPLAEQVVLTALRASSMRARGEDTGANREMELGREYVGYLLGPVRIAIGDNDALPDWDN